MIRADALEIVVKSELQRLVSFYQADEEEFVNILNAKANKEVFKEKKRIEAVLSKVKSRLKELAICYKSLFEKNLSGEIDDKHFELLVNQYDIEEETLKEKLTVLTDDLQRIEREAFGQDRFLKAVRKFMELEQ